MKHENILELRLLQRPRYRAPRTDEARSTIRLVNIEMLAHADVDYRAGMLLHQRRYGQDYAERRRISSPPAIDFSLSIAH